MRQYETTFIIDPGLSGDEQTQTANMYIDHFKAEDCEIVHVEDWGLRPLRYTINKRNSGRYFTVEYKGDGAAVIEKLELAFRRDERILRYLTVKLDKFGVKYNDDKRKGLIGKKKKEATEEVAEKAEK
jgi:small subunit ribosomal protein S6